jgi:hypothetical protein
MHSEGVEDDVHAEVVDAGAGVRTWDVVGSTPVEDTLHMEAEYNDIRVEEHTDEEVVHRDNQVEVHFRILSAEVDSLHALQVVPDVEVLHRPAGSYLVEVAEVSVSNHVDTGMNAPMQNSSVVAVVVADCQEMNQMILS